MWEPPTSGANFYGVNKKILRKSSNLEIMFYGFLREKKHVGFKKRWFGPFIEFHPFTNILVEVDKLNL
jgi:hypothetical protein